MSGDTLSTLREVRLEPLEARQLLAFGQIDESFGSGGQVITPIGALAAAAPAVHELEVVADQGTILAGGSGGLVQWTSDGDVDPDFGDNGNIPLPGTIYRDHDVAPDGTIYVLASSDVGGFVVRYTRSGQPDPSFGVGGSTLISVGPTFTPAAIAVQDDGKVVVAGSVRTNIGDGARARVYRLSADGSADLAFGNGASIDLQLGAGDPIVTPVQKDTIAGLKILSGGKIILAGSSLAYSPEFYDDEAGIFRPVVYGDSVFATARLTPSGQPDTTYGDGGVSRSVYASAALPAPATAFAHRDTDDAIALAAYTDRLVYAQFNASGVVAFNRAAPAPGFGIPLDMATKQDGRFMLVGVAEAVTGYGLQVAYISPGGELSNTIQTSDLRLDTVDLAEAGPAAIAVAQDGNILIGGRPGDGSAAYQLVKLDDGKVDVQRPDHFAQARGNDIVRDAAGGVHLAYFDATERVLKYAYRAPNGLWAPTVTVDDAPESGHYLSIAVDAGARPGIAYFDGHHGDLKFAFSSTDGRWSTQLVEGPGIVGLYPSLQFDSTGRATIAYYKKTGGDLKLAALQPQGQWTYELIDAMNDVGRSAALVAQPTVGLWSIAYTDTTTGDVKLAWRTKARTWAIEVAATTTGGADFLSLAYNPSTEPGGVYQRAAISYFDAYNADLKLTQSSGDGALVWTPRILSTQGVAGLYTHLTFDAFFGPTVYYYNRTFDRVTRLTDHFHDGVTTESVAEGAGRFLSVFSDGNTIDLAYFDEDEGLLKVQSMPVRV
ncbi:MAG TPA: hypothetical protein VGR35_07935 [Tepidisphaeraceae bacterium]|nr:hypothetical protein [Tepidisphaeraceae bacterium]